MSLSARKPFKNYSNDYINNQWFRDLFYIICRTQICRPSLKFKFLQFSNKSIFESAKETKKMDLNYYTIRHKWFSMAYIILGNYAEHKFSV